MKLNQFAYQETTPDVQITELNSIGIPTSANSLAELAREDFYAFEPQALTRDAKQSALAAKAASDGIDVATYLNDAPTSIPAETFATIALQYLDFECGTDFEFGDALAFAAQTQLPMPQDAITSQANWITAIYRLLNTRTKRLVTLIDLLAERGLLRKQPATFTTFNGKTLPVFNARDAIRERVWIESDLDSDHDGQRDMLEVTIIRPVETNTGLRVPALFTANPYFRGTNDVTAATHTPEDTLAVKPARTQAPATTTSQLDLPHRRVDGETEIAAAYGDEPGIYSLNDYFLARGFATVYSAGIGTRQSDGLRSTGGPDETASAVAVIEWLGGTRRAFTTRDGHTAIKAWWCNQSVAMTGKSYLGTLAIAAATSGNPALKTVISEAAISSWYDYYREGGLVVAPGGFQGEDADVLAVDTYSRMKDAGDAGRVRAAWNAQLAALARDQDREFGDYTPFWDARNYRNQLDQIRCPIVSVHGLNDWNVKPRNVIKLHEGLKKHGITHKLFLHQGQHVYLNNVRSLDFTDQMNLWLTNKLLGIANEADTLVPDVTIQDNVTPETWTTQSDFAAGANTHELTIPLGTETQQFTDRSTAHFNAAHDSSRGFETHIIDPDKDSIYADDRVMIPLPELPADTLLEGTPTLKLTLSIDTPSAIVSARLVEVGTVKRFNPVTTTVGPKAYPLGASFAYDNIVEFETAKKTTPVKLITFAHLNTQNPDSAAVSVAPSDGSEMTVTLTFQPTHYRLHDNCQLALIIHGADMAQTIRPVATPTFTLSLTKSTLSLPVREITTK